MPITVVITQKFVQEDNDTTKILDLYRDALERNGINPEIDGVKHVGDAALGESKIGLGFIAKLGAKAEDFSGIRFGAYKTPLPEKLIELETPAELLLRHYLNFLNEKLLEEKVDVTQTKKNATITSVYVLVQQLLYRLAATALSNKSDDQNDGRKLKNAINDFVNKIHEEEVLIKNNKLGKLALELSTEHENWVRAITNMINIAHVVNSNRANISNTLNQLRDAERIIQRQIIFYINEEKGPSSRPPEWLDVTLEECEKSVLDNGQPKNPLTLSVLTQDLMVNNNERLRLSLTIDERQKAIISHLKRGKNLEAALPRVTQLYGLLNQVRYLCDLMSRLDSLMNITGWLPVLSGVINFKKLSTLISNFGQSCNVILSIPEPFKTTELQKKKGSGRGLHKYKALSGNAIAYQLTDNDLEGLDDHFLKGQIRDMIIGAVSSLVELQDQLPAEQRFVNLQKLGLENNNVPFFPVQQPLPPRALKTVPQPKQPQLPSSVSPKREKRSEGGEVFTTTELLHMFLFEGCKDIGTLETFKKLGANFQAESSEAVCSRLLSNVLASNEYIAPNFEDAQKVSGENEKELKLLQLLTKAKTSYNGCSALHYAAMAGSDEVCKWLVEEQGVPIDIADKSGKTPLDWASEKRKQAVIEYLKSKGARSEKVQVACNSLVTFLRGPILPNQNTDIVKNWIHAGAYATADQFNNLLEQNQNFRTWYETIYPEGLTEYRPVGNPPAVIFSAALPRPSVTEPSSTTLKPKK